jgi:outer membrane protein assembly factor BamB
MFQCLDAVTGALVWSRDVGKNAAAASPVLGSAGGVTYFFHWNGEVGRLDDGKVLFKAAHCGLERYWATGRSADGRIIHYVRGAVLLPDDPADPPRQLWALADNLMKRSGNKTDGWIIEGGHSYCAPVVHDGIVYFYETCGGLSSALDAATGGLIYGPITPRKGESLVRNGHTSDASYSDMSLAGKHLIMFSMDGDSVVLNAGGAFRVLHRNPPVGPVVANNPVFEGRRMYMRTERSLFCIEKPQGTDKATK